MPLPYHINTDDLHYLAEATRNAGLFEELRARTCERRLDHLSPSPFFKKEDQDNCDCKACKRYGLERYWDFQLHQDRYPPQSKDCGAQGVCFCWVCDMGRYDFDVYEPYE